MKRLVGFGLIIITILFGVTLAPQPALASAAQQGSTWSAAIAYFNPTGSDGDLTVSYYPEGASGFTPTQLNVNSHYSGTILVGATPGTEGSAVLSSNFQMPAVYKIAGSSGDPYGVIMLEFFTASQIGTQYFYLPVVRKEAGGLTSRIGIQNIENDPVDVVLTFINAAGNTAFSTTLQDIEPQYSAVFKTTDAEFSGLATGFDGALIISATLDEGGGPAHVVAASADITTAEDRAVHSYQGAKGGSTSVYVPAVFCDYGRSGLSTTFHIQNVSGGEISTDTLTITYYNAAGSSVATYSTPTVLLSIGQRVSIDVCAAGSAVNGQQLSAKITHATAPIAVVIETTDILDLSATSTSYTNCSTAPCQVTLPYVEWSSSAYDFQTSIYVMNTGSGGNANVTITYYRRDATSEEQTFVIPQNAMVTTDPTQVANLMNMNHRDFKGAVMLSSDKPIMALVLVTKRFQNPDGSIVTKGDSYMGLEYNP